MLLCSFVVLAACGGAQTHADDFAEAPPDTNDRCPALRAECIEGFDYQDDGCPDAAAPEVVFAPGSATLDDAGERVLEAVGIDGRHLWPGATIRLVAVSEGEDELATTRIANVRAGLVARGVPADRITEGDAASEGTATPSVRIVADGCAFVSAP